ncbi:MAG: response regulator [Candidatus Rokubacteria bacterium]|nr:response regulator [Candidatus Rokubacteria bacterium]
MIDEGAAADSSCRRWLLEGGPVRVLHVGGEPADAERIRSDLGGHGARFAVEGVLTATECLTRASGEPFDVLLLDDRATDMSGLEIVRLLGARQLRVPVVLLLRDGDEQGALEAVKLGVYDYLVKRPHGLGKLPLVLENAATQHRLRQGHDAFAVLGQLLPAVGAGSGLGETLEQVVQAAGKLLKTERNLVLTVESGDTLVPRAWTGFEARELAGARFPADDGVWSEVLARAAPSRLDPIALGGPSSVAPGMEGVASALAVPLAVRGSPFGALVAGSAAPRRFSTSDETLARVLASHAAVAVQNACLAAELVHAERLSTVGRLAAGVAHELNSPLTVVLGTLELLRDEPVDSRLAERLARLSAQARHAVEIVRTLSTLARKRPSRRSPVAVNELVAATLELEAYEFKHADVEVVRRFREDLPRVLGDPGQLQQVFAHLFLNAAEAMREVQGDRTLTVTTELDPATDRIAVTVADTGAGIKPGHLPRLFEPFFTTKGEEQGTGLGLTVCRRIVENLGGRITVTSRSGSGTEFRVELPVSAAGRAAEVAPRPETPAPPAGVSVLLVEDEPLVADILAEILSLDGHRVDRAANGREALACVGARPYRLIVSDVHMPDLDGPAFYEALLGVQPALARRVVFVTGDVVNPETRRFLDETGLTCLEKPFAVSDFQSAVRRALSSG